MGAPIVNVNPLRKSRLLIWEWSADMDSSVEQLFRKGLDGGVRAGARETGNKPKQQVFQHRDRSIHEAPE
jgi:hypothetical protein